MDAHSTEQMRKITIAQAAIVSAYAEIEAMKVANQECMTEGLPLAYNEEAFSKVVYKNGADWNSVITLMN